MKRNLLLKILSAAIVAVMGVSLYAQDFIEFLPSELTPNPDSGYYIVGYDKDEGGTLVHYDSCTNEFQGFHHFEAGEYNGFTYREAMVMPDCPPKNDPPTEGLKLGYIQLKKAKYPGTDSADYGEIMSPPISNLSEMEVHFSVDVTPLSNRPVVAWIQYSTDDGATWANDAFIQWKVTEGAKAGVIEIYNSDHASQGLAFQALALASQTAPIRLRIVAAVSWPIDPSEYAQRVRVFYWKIAGTALGTNNVLVPEKPFYKIIDNVVMGIDGKIEVFNLLGQQIARSESVSLTSGVYIVRGPQGNVDKIRIK